MIEPTKAAPHGSYALKLQTLKKRPEFQRVRGGARYACAAFVIEGKLRASSPTEALEQPRFGFTITKKIGNAVVRNRIRRRLRAALAAIAPTTANQHTDYVVIARLPAVSIPFSELQASLQTAFRFVHTARADKTNPRPSQKPAQIPKKV